jgi:drug/metabolite transporter (DMT)-like permease
MPQLTALLVFAVSLISVAGSQLLFKTRMMQLGEVSGADSTIFTVLSRLLVDPLFWGAGLMVGVGAVCWYSAMIKLPLSFMLPIASLIAPMTAVGAYFWLGESLPPEKLAAIAWIAVGAVWLGYLSS